MVQEVLALKQLQTLYGNVNTSDDPIDRKVALTYLRTFILIS